MSNGIENSERGKGFKTASGCVVALIVCCVGLIVAAKMTMNSRNVQAEQFAQRFADLGYRVQSEDAIIVRERTEGPILLRNTSEFKPLYINSNVKGDLAVIAASVVIAGKIDGNVDIFTSKLTVLGSGEIRGTVTSAFPMEATIEGLVAGEISGEILNIDRTPPEEIEPKR